MAPKSTRAEKAALALELRTGAGDGEGLSMTAIAREMGLSVQYVSQLLSDPTGEIQRQRKRKYMNHCKTCQAPCHGEYCHEHVPRGGHREWDEEAIIDAIQVWDERYGRPPFSEEWMAKNDNRPDWVPSASTVYRVFGKNGWNKAVEAAGLTPRPATFPEWHLQDAPNAGSRPSPEARERLSRERKELYETDPDNPMWKGLYAGHEKARRKAARRQQRPPSCEPD